jgi:hypothetical protein
MQHLMYVLYAEGLIPLYHKIRKGNHMSSVAVVPDKTEIESPNYVKLVEQYRLYARQTAENVIGLAETLDYCQKGTWRL